MILLLLLMRNCWSERVLRLGGALKLGQLTSKLLLVSFPKRLPETPFQAPTHPSLGSEMAGYVRPSTGLGLKTQLRSCAQKSLPALTPVPTLLFLPAFPRRTPQTLRDAHPP